MAFAGMTNIQVGLSEFGGAPLDPGFRRDDVDDFVFGMTDNYAAAPSPASTKSSAAHTAAACARLHSSCVVRELSG